MRRFYQEEGFDHARRIHQGIGRPGTSQATEQVRGGGARGAQDDQGWTSGQSHSERGTDHPWLEGIVYARRDESEDEGPDLERRGRRRAVRQEGQVRGSV